MLQDESLLHQAIETLDSGQQLTVKLVSALHSVCMHVCSAEKRTLQEVTPRTQRARSRLSGPPNSGLAAQAMIQKSCRL